MCLAQVRCRARAGRHVGQVRQQYVNHLLYVVRTRIVRTPGDGIVDLDSIVDARYFLDLYHIPVYCLGEKVKERSFKDKHEAVRDSVFFKFKISL